MSNSPCKVLGQMFTENGCPSQSHGLNLTHAIASLLSSEHMSLLLGAGFSIGFNPSAPVSLSCQGKTLPTWCNDLATNQIIKDLLESSPAIDSFEQIIQHIEVAIEFYKNKQTECEKYQQLQKEIMSKLIKAITAFESSIPKNSYSAGIEFLFRLINRPAHFNRPHIFTTNYDRLVEHICEQLHIRVIDRFVGTLSPKFSSDPLNINYHYTPPGIKGEPRYLEQVIHYTKLHGSLDWYEQEGQGISRIPHPFGQENIDSNGDNASKVLIYPKASKSIETLLFPYSELFRDFQHAVCRHNSLLITYGYSFRDSHINSIIESMLRIPSTHLLIITKDSNETIKKLQTKNNVSWMIGENFTNFSILNSSILPAPTIYKHLQRAYKLQTLLSSRETSSTEEGEQTNDQ